ncbi:MAG: TolC family protein [Candidatus Omnitrophota bacterium]
MCKVRCFLLIMIFAAAAAGAVPEKMPVPEEVCPGEEKTVLSLDEFLRLAGENDTEFEQILIDALALQYQHALKLPAGDLVLSVKQQHEFFFDQDRDSPDTTVSLSKLFPYLGTTLTASYQAGASMASAVTSSEANFSISQPIAQNAFGRSTRLLDKIVGLEVDVARHQIIEAYEDYLAVVLTAYYNWYEDYKNLKVGRSSYQTNLRLLDNIHERRKQKIALPIDVNKVKLQVMAKQEQLIELEDRYRNSLNIVKRIIRYEGDASLVPSEPDVPVPPRGEFKELFRTFHEESRTFEVLRMLEKKSGLQVDRDADVLLPSIDLLIGYEIDGNKYGIENENNFFYAGVELEWPIGHQTERAQYEISRILERRTRLSTVNTYYRLYTQLRNLYLQIQREQRLIDIAQQRIELAQAVLDDEAENYSFGRVTLNDYIQAVNALDANRFNKIARESLYKKLVVEWQRLTDQLVQLRGVTRELEQLKSKR